MARVRFEDVDLLGALSRIVDLHTQHYKEDFDLDKELISKLAVSDRSEDKQLLWMSRPCGTYTLREREVYLDGSHENKVWRFYQEQTNDPVLAYAISLKEVRDGKIFGNLYPLNYREHVERMKADLSNRKCSRCICGWKCYHDSLSGTETAYEPVYARAWSP